MLIIFSREFSHRVKSVSMAKFTPQEIASLQAGGNEVNIHKLLSIFMLFSRWSYDVSHNVFYTTCSTHSGQRKYTSEIGTLSGNLFLIASEFLLIFLNSYMCALRSLPCIFDGVGVGQEIFVILFPWVGSWHNTSKHELQFLISAVSTELPLSVFHTLWVMNHFWNKGISPVLKKTSFTPLDSD